MSILFKNDVSGDAATHEIIYVRIFSNFSH
jgi:hypothetical protein